MINRIVPIDGLRGLAVILVILHHSFDPMYGFGPVWDKIFSVLSLGWVGVDLFFVISGFLITGILINTRENKGYFVNFYTRRALRIFPLYYAFCIFALIVVPKLPGSEPATFENIRNYQSWLWFYATNCLIAMKHAWVFSANNFELNHLWSLCVEEHFYLIWPFIVWRLSLTRLKIVCLSAIVIILIGRTAYLLYSHDYITAYILTPCRIDALLIGSFCAVLARQMTQEKFKVFAQAAFAVTLVLMAFSLRLCNWQLSLTFAPSIGLSLSPLFFAAVLSFVVTHNHVWISKTILGSGILPFFGKYSYALYLFHFPLLKFLAALGTARFLIELMHSRLAGLLAFNCVVASIALLFAIISWHFFEKHFLKLKHHFGN